MKDDRAEGRPTHPRVGNADHVGDSRPQELRRNRQMAPFRHAGRALGTAVLQHHHGIWRDLQFRIVHPAGEVINVVEDDGQPRMLFEGAGRGASLDDCTARRQASVQHADCASGPQWPT